MKGVLLCGGMGSRLAPITKVVNKNILPVGPVPLVYHSLNKLRDAGVDDILITCGSSQFGQLVELLEDGTDLGVDLTFKVQNKALGISHAISLAEKFVDGEPFVVMLGDNVFEDEIDALVRAVQRNNCSYVGVKDVDDPQRFGVVRYTDGKVAEIVEKPAMPPSKDAVIGIYGYQCDAFDKIRQLNPSTRGELEVTDLNNLFLAEGRLDVIRFRGYWIDAGTHESLYAANEWYWGQSR